MTEREDSEAAAAEIVRLNLGVEVEPIDRPGAPPGSPDFAIHLDETVPLEVTRVTDPDYRSFWTEVSRRPRHIDGVARSWWIVTRFGPVNVRELLAGLKDVLPRLEAARIEQFGRPSDPEVADARPLVPLGVVAGRVAEGVTGPNGESIIVFGNSGGLVTGPEVINDLCEVQAANNREKLQAGGHLWVWIDSLAGQEWVAMDLDRPPRDRPALIPAGITIWIARQRETGTWEPDRLWRLSPTRSWETVDGAQ